MFGPHMLPGIKVPDPWPIGTKAIVRCLDYYCLGVKGRDGRWTDIQSKLLSIEDIETVLSLSELDSSLLLSN